MFICSLYLLYIYSSFNFICNISCTLYQFCILKGSPVDIIIIIIIIIIYKLVDRSVRNRNRTTNMPDDIYSARFRGRADLGWILRVRTTFGRESGRLSGREDYSSQGKPGIR